MMRPDDSIYEQLKTFVDVKLFCETVSSRKAFEIINEAVDMRFLRQQLVMTDADWQQWTVLVESMTTRLDAEAAGQASVKAKIAFANDIRNQNVG